MGPRIAIAALCLASACSTTLEQGLDEREADEIVVALADHGIGATKEAERGGSGFDVIVLESDLSRALGVLRDEGLPRDDESGLAETYAEPSLIPTAGEERARLAHALAQDLARTIESLDGVRSARVHVGLPDPSVVPMDDAPPIASASVLVRCAEDAVIDEPAIRALVAGAVPGLAAERVVVVTRVAAPPREHTPLEHVGPIAVSAGSAAPLRAILAVMLLVNVALAIGIGAIVMRRRR